MKLSESRFWDALWDRYSYSPSIAICRVPELEYASNIVINKSVLLDHCCGDGFFSKLCWDNTSIEAGCDLNDFDIKAASDLNLYKTLNVCDASKLLPYDDDMFDIIFNNSALEHIENLSSTLSHIERVLKPNGVLVFNVLNHRYFEWWPLDEHSKQAYKKWQPFFHAYSIDHWQEILNEHNLEIVDYQGYFAPTVSKMFAWLDYKFSGHALGGEKSAFVFVFNRTNRISSLLLKLLMSSLQWKTDPDEGAGYFIKVKKNELA